MLLTMSNKELNRIDVIKDVVDRKIRQVDAAKTLGLSRRQIQRCVNRYKKSGAQGLISLKRGMPSNHRYPEAVKAQTLSIIKENYHDFGPTFAAEKLRDHHNISLSNETVRQWMMVGDLWVPRSKKRPRIHPPRHRREHFGELVQVDGSHHDWFEGRAPKCCLLVYIDDATSEILHLYFCDSESTFSYMASTKSYLEQHGKPVAFYTDKLGVFRVNHPQSQDVTALTQYGRALNELNIELICANTPQAKGRVERANRTLQDRLIKEMRLAGINTIEEANAWLSTFIESHNKRFAKPPYSSQDLHRPVLETHGELDDILSWQSTRVVSKSLTVQYDKVRYLLEQTPTIEKLIGKTVIIHDYPDGRLSIKHSGEPLPCKAFDKLDRVRQSSTVDNKRLGVVLRHAYEKQQEMEAEGLRERSQSAPHRNEQVRASAMNPAVVEALQTQHSSAEAPESLLSG